MGNVTRLCGIALFGAVLLLTATTTPHMAVIAGGGVAIARSRRMKQHECPVPDGYECVNGSLYDDSVRTVRPLCNCGCHLPPGTTKRKP